MAPLKWAPRLSAKNSYLALASVAAKVMQPHRRYLPPFESNTQVSQSVVLLVVTWTAILAIGCLRVASGKSDDATMPGAIWFLLVLAIVWIVHLAPVVRHLLGGAI